MRTVRWLGMLIVSSPALVVAQPCPTVDIGGPQDCNQNGILDSCEVEPREIGLVPGRIHEIDGTPENIQSGDFNGDGRGDLAIGTSSGLEIFYGYPSGALDRGPIFPEVGTLDEFAICDLNGDGRDDLAVLRRNVVAIYLTDDGGIPRGPATLSLDPEAALYGTPVAGDMNNDGATDLIYRSTGGFQVLPGDGEGSFLPARALLADADVSEPAFADVDGDQILDVVAKTYAIEGTRYLRVYRNDGTGRFPGPPADIFSGDLFATEFWLEDLDSDGAVDVLISTGPGFLLARNRGDGTYEPPEDQPSIRPTVGNLRGLDLDQDGDLDLAGTLRSGLVVFENEPGEEASLPSFTANPEHAWKLPRIPAIVNLALVDPDGDGVHNLAALAEAGSHSQVTIVRTIDVPRSLDCNENAIPDSCDIEGLASADCSRQNGFADGIPDECQVPPDCNENGVPDFCEEDCNANRRPDDCDLALGDSEDLDGNGVPDECQVEGPFELRLQGPGTMLSGSREVYSVVLTPGSEIRDSTDGAQGWSFGIGTRGLTIVDATTYGTLLRDPVHGFGSFTEPNFNNVRLTTGEGNEGVTAAFVIFGFYTLPTDIAIDVLRIEVESRAAGPSDGEPALLYFRDDLRSEPGGKPTPVGVTRRGVTVLPSTRDREVTVGGLFLRGDANADATLSISDPIFGLMGLFVGGFWYECEKSADANDDGRVDISDAVFTLAYLFLGTATIPEPLNACGLDATVDDLSCEDFAPCTPSRVIAGSGATSVHE